MAEPEDSEPGAATAAPASAVEPQRGYDLSLFVAGASSLRARRLVCPRCDGVVRAARESPCGHVAWCSSCLAGAACPSCGAAAVAAPSAPRSRFLDQMVADERVRCVHAARGCAWEGALAGLREHLGGPCGLSLVPCPHCAAPVPRAGMDAHAAACERRAERCGGCGRAVEARHAAEHARDGCAAARAACAACGEEMPRGTLARHAAERCPEAEAACPHPGCAHRGRRASLPAHEREARDAHLALALGRVSRLEDEVASLREAVRQLALGGEAAPGALLRRLVAGGAGGGAELVAAARRGAGAAEVRRLLAAGAAPDAREASETGASALMWAAAGNDAEAAEALVRAGADVSLADAHGHTALFYAAMRGSAASLSALLRLGSDPNRANLWGWTSLHRAAAFGHAGCVRVLLAAGARADLANGAGQTSLILAAKNGHADACGLLLDAGAPARARDRSGCTARDWALGAGHSVVADLLRRRGRGLRSGGGVYSAMEGLETGGGGGDDDNNSSGGGDDDSEATNRG